MPELLQPASPDRHRILLISNAVFHYRVGVYNEFARRFREVGYEFVVRANALQPGNPYPREFDFQALPFGFGSYKREIERIQPACVILFLHLKNLFLWPLLHWLKATGIPVVYWNKGINLEVRHPWLRNQLFYYVHARVDALLLYSQHNVTDIRPRNRHKVFVAPNTINFDALPVVSESREQLKREFGIPFRKTVLFVGRMRRVKKVEHLIEAFNTIDEPGAGCVIVGDSMDYDLRRLIKTDRIRYLGPIFDPKNDQVSRLFKASDLFCIPGDVGLGMNEAFHWGLPVVTEDGLQPPEIHYLKNGRNGLIVPEDDVGALRAALLWLLRDDALRSFMSEAARADIAAEASIERMFQGFLDCVRFIAPQGHATQAEAVAATH